MKYRILLQRFEDLKIDTRNLKSLSEFSVFNTHVFLHPGTHVDLVMYQSSFQLLIIDLEKALIKA